MNRLINAYGQLALVTGATDGIGRAFAEELAAAGFDLILVARRDSELRRIADALIARHSVQVETFAVDLSAPTSTPRILEMTRKRDIGILVAAAGFGTSGTFVEVSIDVELQMMDVNCRSVVELCHGVGQHMVTEAAEAWCYSDPS